MRERFALYHSRSTPKVAAEAAAAFHFEDSGLAPAREEAGAKAEPAAGVAVGLELRPDRTRAHRHRRILPRLRPRRGLHR